MKKDNLLLLHGALGCKDQLSGLTKLLANKYDVYTMNFEGHGNRPSDQNFSIPTFASNIEQFLIDEKIDHTHIFGFSMGGYVALKYALDHPEVVRSIITLGTKFHWTQESAAREVKMLNPEKVIEKVPAFAAHLEKMHTHNPWQNVMTKTAQMMIAMGKGERLYSSDLKLIRQKTLICLGSLDNMVTPEESQLAAMDLPNGQFLHIENFHHPIERIDGQVMATIIDDFINSLS